MKICWLLVCNATKACIYDITKGESHSLLHTLDHPKGHLKDSELVTYQMGRFGPGGEGPGVHAPHNDPHETEITRFAQEIAIFVDKEKSKNHFSQLILCAEPHFQGHLNKLLSEQVRKTISDHILKDYLPLSKSELEEVIQKIQKEYI